MARRVPPPGSDARRALRRLEFTLSPEAESFLDHWGAKDGERGERSIVLEAAITVLRRLLDREILAEIEGAKKRRAEITRKHRDAMSRTD